LDKIRQEISDRITEVLTVSCKPTQWKFSTFIVLSGWTWYKISAHNAVEYLWVSWEQLQRRPNFRQDSKSNCVYTCAQKQHDILKVRNALKKLRHGVGLYHLQSCSLEHRVLWRAQDIDPEGCARGCVFLNLSDIWKEFHNTFRADVSSKTGSFLACPLSNEWLKKENVRNTLSCTTNMQVYLSYFRFYASRIEQ
jgi:hypothetical protein